MSEVEGTAEPAETGVSANQAREVDALLETLRELGRFRAPLFRSGIAVFGFCALGVIAFIGLVNIDTARFYQNLAMLLLFLCAFSAMLVGGTASRKQIATARRLAQIADKRAITALAEIWHWPNLPLTREAERALMHLLPQLRADDAHLLPPELRRALYLMLSVENVKRAPDFTITVLNALEQIGDSQAASYVKPLARRSGTTPDEQRVQQTAQSCLAALAERERSEQILLRPSAHSAGQASREALLRPAAHDSNPVPNELLRPLSSEEDSIE